MRVWKPLTTRWNYVVIDTDKDMGGYKLTNLGGIATADILLKQANKDGLIPRDAADLTTMDFYADEYKGSRFWTNLTSSGLIDTQAANNAYMMLRGWDTGVGFAEVARITGAPIAYFNLISGRSRMDNIDLRNWMLVWGLTH